MRRVAGDAFAKRASADSGCRVPGVGRRSRWPLHHHYCARIGALKSERDGALLDGGERRAAIELQLQRLVRVLDLLLLFLKARRFVSEADHLEVLPGEEEQERTDRNAERKDGQQLTGAPAVAFANDMGVLDRLLLRVHAGTIRETARSLGTRVKICLQVRPENHPHPPTLPQPPLPSSRGVHTPTLPQPSPLFPGSGLLRTSVTSPLLRNSQLRTARSRISLNFFLRSSDRTAGQNLHDFLRAAAAHRQVRRAGALPFQPPQRAFDDA